MKHSYAIDDLFVSGWGQLNAAEASALFFYKTALDSAIKNKKYLEAGKYRALITRLLIRNKQVYASLTAEQIRDITEDMKWLNDKWYDFHVTWIDVGSTRLKAPGERGHTWTFWQWCKADAEYSKVVVMTYNKQKGIERAVDRLVAIIYTPDGGFDEDNIEPYAKMLPKRLEKDLKYLIFHTFANIREYVMDRCPNLLPRGSEKAEPTYTGQMWQDVLFDLADSQAFGGIDRAKNAPMYQALDYLEKRAGEVSKIKARA